MEEAGTTDTTPEFLRSFSVVDELELSDSEFDELSPIPETPSSPYGNVDTVDSGEAQGHPSGLPFGKVFEVSGGLGDEQANVWLPGIPINIKITGYDRQPTIKLLNPNLYTIEVEHGEFKWIVKRRYKHFQQLHNKLLLYRARYRIPLPSKGFQERRKTFRKERVSVKFPKRPEALITTEQVPRRMKQLEEYLQTLLKCRTYRNDPETRKFFEVCPLSFIKHLGMKHREGFVKKCSGGRRISIGCCGCLKKFHFAGHWNTRWLVLRDTFLAYIRPSDGMVSDVMLMDSEFSVSAGMGDTGAPHGLLVSNLSRKLLVKCWTRRKAREWEDAIEKAASASQSEFKQTRFKSFAPARDNSFTRWFVDGGSYFEAVAEALEKAKEEIYITDWWLSPEIYLKRPITEGDKWRLDVVLQRKAEDGVKVFILLYKEVEMALGIRSTYTKQTLMQRHPNIKVLRHPDHGAGGVLLWAHHEKLVVVDQSIAFLGGFDLCYGRWDNQQHRLTDLGSVTYKQPQPQPQHAQSNLSLSPEYSSTTNMTVISDTMSEADAHAEDIASVPSACSPNQVTVTISPPSPSKGVLGAVKTGSDRHLNTAFSHEEREASPHTQAEIHTHVQLDSSPAFIRVPSKPEELVKGEHPTQGESPPGVAGSQTTAVKDDVEDKKKWDDTGRHREAGDVRHSGTEEKLDAESREEVTKIYKIPTDYVDAPATVSEGALAQSSSQAAAAGATASSSQQGAEGHKPTETMGQRKHLWGAPGRKKLALIMPKWHSSENKPTSSSSSTPPPTKPATAPALWHDSIALHFTRNADLAADEDEVDFASPIQEQIEIAAQNHATLGLSPGKRRSHTGSDSSASQTSQCDMLPHNECPDGKGPNRRRKKEKERNNNDGNNLTGSNTGSLKSDPGIGQTTARRRWKKVFHVQKFESRIHQRQEPETHIEGFIKMPQTPSTASHLFRRKHLGLLRDKRSSMEMIAEDGRLMVPGFGIYRTTSELAIQEQGLQGSTKLWIGKDYVNFIHKDFVQLELPFEDFIDRTRQPRMPWHDVGVMVYGKAARDVARHFIGRWNFTKIEKCKKNNLYPVLLPKTYNKCSVPPGIRQITFQARTQILRSLHAWSGGIRTPEKSIEAAYIHCIDNAKHYIYIENQFFITHVGDSPTVSNKIGEALYRRILRAHRSREKFRVFVVMPLLPAFEGEFGTTQGAALQAVTYWNFNSICRGQHSLLENLAREVPDPLEYICFCGLRTHGELMGKLVTELVYVHSKLMIVDDNVAIIGSANINDRSMLGRRDSELAILVEDTHFFPATLNGASVQVGYFASSLRRTLFREHLGLKVGDHSAEVADIVTDYFYKNVWLRTATTNTKVFDEVFRCIPCDDVLTFDEMRAYTAQSGLAETNPDEARIQLAKVRGYLVLVPLHFLKKENLAPSGKEGLLPYYLWT